MPAAPMTIRLDSVRLDRALSAFVRRQVPGVASKVVRAMAFKVGDGIVRRLNGAEAGYTNPKRIDTGRYRAAWAVGTAQGAGVRPTAPGAPTSRSGDGQGLRTGTGAAQVVTVTNSVEYGPWIEYGTPKMRAGLHVRSALDAAAREVEGLVWRPLQDAWGAS